jgi:hypothetical protein
MKIKLNQGDIINIEAREDLEVKVSRIGVMLQPSESPHHLGAYYIPKKFNSETQKLYEKIKENANPSSPNTSYVIKVKDKVYELDDDGNMINQSTLKK